MKIFAYGTLRQGCSRGHVFEEIGAKKLHDDLICATMYTTKNRNWPFLVIAPNIYTVVNGEVYEMDDNKITQTDRIEGYSKDRKDNLFERTQVNTLHENDLVWVYVGGSDLVQNHRSVKIEYGDWLAYKLMLDGYQRNTKFQQENIKNLLTRSSK